MALQAQQIISLACAIAKCPNFLTQAGQLLNSILQDLAQTYDFDVARGVAAIILSSATGAGPYNLPADYLRANPEDVFYTINGVKYSLVNIDIKEYDLLVQTAGFMNFPTYYATDMSQAPPVLYVWAPPSGAFPVTIRYFRQMPDIATPETSVATPWFPNQTYLIRRLAGELMLITNDERAPTFLGDDKGGFGAQAVLRRYLEMKDDKTGRAQTVRLDRRRFGAPYDALPNTKAVGW